MALGETPLRLAAVTRKPGAASFLQRIAHHIAPLRERGIHVEPLVLPRSIRGQHDLVCGLRAYDGVWWQRHLLMPWWLPCLRRAAKVLVFDFDDPVCLSSAGGGRSSWSRRLRFGRLLRRCDAVIAAGDHLAQLARPYCRDVRVVPMPIDPPPEAPPRHPDGPPTLLWLGSRATQPYLELIRRPLEELGRRRPGVTLRLVAHDPWPLKNLNIDFRHWSEPEQELALRACDIGLCPLPDTAWAAGKFPYKVVQYMAYGLPWVGSAVGENEALAAGAHATGLVASNDPAVWLAALLRLVDDVELRHTLGAAGRRRVLRHHDRKATADTLAALWRGWCAAPAPLS